MDPEDLLQELCRCHGLEAGEQRDLLPLVQKALLGPPAARERLRALIEDALRLRALRGRDPRTLERSLEEGLLVAVARALHGWSPEDGPPRLGDTGR